MSSSKTVFITGATAGIGRTTALHLATLGHHVIASGRKRAELDKLAAEGRGLTGKLDVVMNVTRAFLPAMQARRAGRIINISSMGGRITLPYFGVYNSTKYAVESLSDALRYELRPFGIDVALIEPGVIRTNFEATAVSAIAGFSSTPYGRALANYERMSKAADRFASNPIVVARAIARAVAARRPAARYVAPRSTNVALWLSAILPTAVWDWAMRKAGYLSPAVLDLSAVPVVISAPAPAPAPVPKVPATAPSGDARVRAS
jgi:short-subunit dehydrogenase